MACNRRDRLSQMAWAAVLFLALVVFVLPLAAQPEKPKTDNGQAMPPPAPTGEVEKPKPEAEQPKVEPPKAGEVPETPQRIPLNFAVFVFGNQTIYPHLDYLQVGFRDAIAATLDAHPAIELVSDQAIDRAIRRKALNPRAAIPPVEALNIARELKADYFLFGSFYDIHNKCALVANLVRPEDPPIVWPLSENFGGEMEPIPAAQRLADMVVHFAGLDALEQHPGLHQGHRVRIRLTTDAGQALLNLSPEQKATILGLSYKIVEGRLVRQADVINTEGETPGGLRVVLDQPSTRPARAAVEFDVLMTCEDKRLRLRAEKVGQGTLDITVHNINRTEEPKLASTLSLDAQTASTEFYLDFDRLTKDGPVYQKAVEYGPASGSLALVKPPEAAPPEGEKPPAEGTKPAEGEPTAAADKPAGNNTQPPAPKGGG